MQTPNRILLTLFWLLQAWAPGLARAEPLGARSPEEGPPTPPAAFTRVPTSSAHLLIDLDGPLQADGVRDLATSLMEEFAIPGAAIGLIRGGEVVCAAGIGVADREQGTLVTSKTLFNVASISKMVAAWSFLRLVEEGRVGLDDPVMDLVTRWKLPESPFDHTKISARHLLNHSAGLSPGSGAGFFTTGSLPTLEEVLTGMRQEGGEIPSPDQILSGEMDGPAGIRVVYEPGSSQRYSNGGYRLLQLVMEEVQPDPFETFARDSILLPLGMTHSTFADPLQLQGDWRPATPYAWRGNAIPLERFVGTAAAGLYTCLDDLLRFMGAELGTLDAPLRRESIQLMQEPQPGSPNYGLGHEIQTYGDLRIVGHSGLGMGWNANFRFAPDRRAGIVVLSNSDNGITMHQVLVSIWLRNEFGIASPGLWSAARKRANRLVAYGGWLVETSTIPKEAAPALLESLENLDGALDQRDVATTQQAIRELILVIEHLETQGALPSDRARELKAHAEAVESWVSAL